MSNASTMQNFPPGTSRYTLAMAKCMGTLTPASPSKIENSVRHALVNLVQGRILEYLADRICREFQICDSQTQVRMVTVLLGIFSDEFFALFRSRIEQEPELLLHIARRIIRKEERLTHCPDDTSVQNSSDRLYPAIFRKFFEYRHLDVLLEMIESDAEIQKIILNRLLKRLIADETLRGELLTLADSDPEGITSSLFMRYIRQESVETLLEMVRTGQWREEWEALRDKMACLRGDKATGPQHHPGEPPGEFYRKTQGF